MLGTKTAHMTNRNAIHVVHVRYAIIIEKKRSKRLPMEWETNIEFIEICTIFFAGLLSHILVVGYVKIGAKNIDVCCV